MIKCGSWVIVNGSILMILFMVVIFLIISCLWKRWCIGYLRWLIWWIVLGLFLIGFRKGLLIVDVLVECFISELFLLEWWWDSNFFMYLMSRFVDGMYLVRLIFMRIGIFLVWFWMIKVFVVVVLCKICLLWRFGFLLLMWLWWLVGDWGYFMVV